MKKKKRLSRLFAAAALAAALPLAFAVNARAASAIFIRNVSGAMSADAGAYYEFYTEGAAIYFEVVSDGIPENAAAFFRTSVSSGDCVASVFPPRGAISDQNPGSVRVDLKPNTAAAEAHGELLLTFEYENDVSETPPKAVVIRITQRGAAAAVEPSVSIDDELAIVAMLESEAVMPGVAINGNTATLSYNYGGVVSWGAGGADAELTIRDVSVLNPDRPLVIEDFRPSVGGVLSGNRYTVTMPAAQVRHILEKRADEAVNALAGRLSLVEDISRSTAERIYLVPAYAPELPRGVTLRSDSPYLHIPNPEILEVTADAEWLASAAGRDTEIFLALAFNNVPSLRPLTLRLELSRPELYPGLYRTDGEAPAAIGEYGVPAVGEPPPAPVNMRVTGRLAQTYDQQLGEFIQRLIGTGYFFTSNIPNGLVTSDAVKLSFPEGMEVSVRRGDEAVETPARGAEVTEPGCYRVQVKMTETISAQTLPDDLSPAEITLEDIVNMQNITLEELLDTTVETVAYEGVFTFRIVSGPTNSLVFFNPPPGYRITGLVFNGIPVTNVSPDYTRLTADGDYAFTVEGAEGEPAFTAEITRFTIPPVVALTGVLNGGTTTKPVSITAESEAAGIAAVSVTLDNALLSWRGAPVSAPGYYTVSAADNAGNQTEVSFRILYSVNISGWMVLALSALAAGALAGVMIYLRTHMRVR